MRLFVLFATAFIGAAILINQAPQAVPAPLRIMVAVPKGGAGLAFATTPKHLAMPGGAAGLVVTAKALPVAAGVVSAVVAGGLALMFFRRPRRSNRPAWIEAARASTPEGRKVSEHRAECRELEKIVVPDIRARGASALARAHQLDLYWRFVSREKALLSGRATETQLAELRETTLATLRSVAPKLNERSLSAFREAKPALNVLARDDLSAVRGFYASLAEQLRETESAWQDARAAVEGQVNAEACLAAMERLRQAQRAVAKDAAALVGDIEVAVRAVA